MKLGDPEMTYRELLKHHPFDRVSRFTRVVEQSLKVHEVAVRMAHILANFNASAMSKGKTPLSNRVRLVSGYLSFLMTFLIKAGFRFPRRR